MKKTPISVFSDFSSKTLTLYKILQFLKVNQIVVYAYWFNLFYYFYDEIKMYLPNVDFVIKIGKISDFIDFSIKKCYFCSKLLKKISKDKFNITIQKDNFVIMFGYLKHP